MCEQVVLVSESTCIRTSVVYQLCTVAGLYTWTIRAPHGSKYFMLCHTLLFILSQCCHVTFYKTLTSLSTVFIKGHIGLLQFLKWPCHTLFLTHVEPYYSAVSVNSRVSKVCHELQGKIFKQLWPSQTCDHFYPCILRFIEAHLQWSLYFKTTHGTKKMWSYIAGGLKIKVI